MGWNDRDDRLSMLMDQGYDFETAMEIRTEQMFEAADRLRDESRIEPDPETEGYTFCSATGEVDGEPCDDCQDYID